MTNLVRPSLTGIKPYAYYNPQGELDGYAIEIFKLIQKELGKSIELNFVETNRIQEAIPKMINGEMEVVFSIVVLGVMEEDSSIVVISES